MTRCVFYSVHTADLLGLLPTRTLRCSNTGPALVPVCTPLRKPCESSSRICISLGFVPVYKKIEHTLMEYVLFFLSLYLPYTRLIKTVTVTKLNMVVSAIPFDKIPVSAPIFSAWIRGRFATGITARKQKALTTSL
jgi:hypothetical protein